MIVKKMMSTIMSFILSLFLVCIALFAMLELLEIQDSEAGVRAFVFASINFLILIVVIGFGKSVASAVGAMYPAICLSTIVYTLVNLSFNFAACNMESTALFTIIDLLIMFVYFCIVAPMVVFGVGNDDEDTSQKNDFNNNNYNIRR